MSTRLTEEERFVAERNPSSIDVMLYGLISLIVIFIIAEIVIAALFGWIWTAFGFFLVAAIVVGFKLFSIEEDFPAEQSNNLGEIGGSGYGILAKVILWTVLLLFCVGMTLLFLFIALTYSLKQ